MNREEILKRIKSIKLCLMAHPDNEPNSEFADRINDLLEIENELSDQTKEKQDGVLADVVGQSEQLVCPHPNNKTYLEGGYIHCEICNGKWKAN